MSWFTFFKSYSTRQPRPRTARPRLAKPMLECLEDRVVPAAADLIAYRPVTDFFNHASFRVLESQEESHTLGPGIRINGDDDNGNTVADFSESGPTAGIDNDLVRVDVAATGTSSLQHTPNLKVWTTQTKQQQVASGASLSGVTVWVEYINAPHSNGTTSAVLTLTASDAAGSATDKLVFHSFRSVVIAIGGNTQDPAKVGDPNLGVFTIASKLYQQGYDVHMYKHSDVSSSGTGAAYNEVTSAVKSRSVGFVSIFGYSWGGGATYELANGLQTSTIAGQYILSYTAYIDAISHGWISSERRLPPGTAYHDNIYQRRDWLLRGNSVTGAVNVNVTNTTWGTNLVHTTIDDNATVQTTIITNLGTKVAR